MLIPYEQIRSHYEFLTPHILETSKLNHKKWVSPYCTIDWVGLFSPIENNTWQALREFGHAPFYPQYPVGPYFVDFGNPFMKIAIECDGHNYHLDKEKDNRRDEHLYELGWKVYRIPGSDCVRPVEAVYYSLEYVYPEDRKSILSTFYYSTIEGLIKALAVEHFGYDVYYDDDYTDELWIVKNCLQSRVSSKQKMIQYQKDKTLLT